MNLRGACARADSQNILHNVAIGKSLLRFSCIRTGSLVAMPDQEVGYLCGAIVSKQRDGQHAVQFAIAAYVSARRVV
jgi:hypothetical protein